MLDTGNGMFPLRPINNSAMYTLYEESDVLRPIIITLKNEVFRTGLAPATRFVVRCDDCGTEYQAEPQPDEENGSTGVTCENCGGGPLVKPDWTERQEIEKFLKKVNQNGQSLKELAKECEKDLNIVDDAYVIAIKDYVLSEDGEIQSWKVKEFVRADPRVMRIVVDKKGRMGGKKWVCIEHRDEVSDAPDKCPNCGNKMHPVHFIATDTEGGTATANYIEGEVCHWSKFDPSLTYGKPPLMTLWQATSTLKNMSEYLNLMFQGQRSPRRFIWMITKSVDGLDAWWKAQLEECKRDPFYIPILAVESESKEGSVGTVDAMDTLQDIQFLPQKEELRQRISAFYGVSNVFQADVAQAGGLNNESRQIMVTDRAVELARTIFREKLFGWICEQKGWTDFIIDFHKIDERDELTRIQLQAKRIANMNGMVSAGFEARLMPDGSFSYTGKGNRVRQKEGTGSPDERMGIETPHLEVEAQPPEAVDREENLE